jgi:hypothetical protein
MENKSNRKPVRYISSVEDANAWIEEERRKDNIKYNVTTFIFALVFALAVSSFGPYGPDWLPRLF